MSTQTKIDLAELERRARAVVGSRSEFELAQWTATHASAVKRWRDEQLKSAADHIAANSPQVTLALVARIRELEGALGGLVAECEERTENPEGDYYAEQREILAKGSVLP
jgi:hypothetical protein